MKVLCCVCQKVRVGGNWIQLNEPVTPGQRVSYGYCPDCAAIAFADLCKGPNLTAETAPGRIHAA